MYGFALAHQYATNVFSNIAMFRSIDVTRQPGCALYLELNWDSDGKISQFLYVLIQMVNVTWSPAKYKKSANFKNLNINAITKKLKTLTSVHVCAIFFLSAGRRYAEVFDAALLQSDSHTRLVF